MSEATLTRILQDLDTLQPTELIQVEQAVQARIRLDEAARRQAFRQALLDAGLVRQLKRGVTEKGPRAPRVEAAGTPVSATIIAERR
jgi:hypothetical protein